MEKLNSTPSGLRVRKAQAGRERGEEVASKARLPQTCLSMARHGLPARLGSLYTARRLRGAHAPGRRSRPTDTTAQLVPGRKKGGRLALAVAAWDKSQSKRLGERGRGKGGCKGQRKAGSDRKKGEKTKIRAEDSQKKGRKQGR